MTVFTAHLPKSAVLDLLYAHRISLSDFVLFVQSVRYPEFHSVRKSAVLDYWRFIVLLFSPPLHLAWICSTLTEFHFRASPCPFNLFAIRTRYTFTSHKTIHWIVLFGRVQIRSPIQGRLSCFLC